MLEIIYTAKCKHCKYFNVGSKYNRRKSECRQSPERPTPVHPNGGTVTLKAKACNKFEL